MPEPWPELPFDSWHQTRDTLHAHTQVLGKLAAALAPPEPQLQHAALRVTARGSSWLSIFTPMRWLPSTATAARCAFR
jgi:hypothetical protein